MLADRLGKEWRARRASAPIDAVMRFSDAGLVLGAGTVLASADASGPGIRIEGDEPRLLALLAAAHSRMPVTESLMHIRNAARRWNEGEPSLAAIHLALSGVDRLRRPEADACRLFLADRLLQAGLPTDTLLKALDLGPPATGALSKYNPNQPRVPAGSGRTSGEWSSTGAGTPVNPSASAHRPAAARSGRPSVRAAQRPAQKPRPPVNQPPAPRSNPGPTIGSHASASTGAYLPASLAAAAVAIGRPGPALDLGALTEEALARLATFLAALGEIDLAATATAASAGLAVGFGVLFIPSYEPTGEWIKVGGPGNISYFRSIYTPGLTIRYTTADGVQREWGGAQGPGGNFRGPDGQVIARIVKTGAKRDSGLRGGPVGQRGRGSEALPGARKGSRGKTRAGVRKLRQGAVQPRQSHPARVRLQVFQPGDRPVANDR